MDEGNGFIERKSGGRYQGRLHIEGIDISPIEGTYFRRQGRTYLWLKRVPLMEYDDERKCYDTRPREPRWESYMVKQVGDGVAYKGEFVFLRFRYTIVGLWDRILGKDNERLNLYVERMPMKEQKIINAINERKRKEHLCGRDNGHLE